MNLAVRLGGSDASAWQRVDEDGFMPYWFNAQSGETSWENPHPKLSASEYATPTGSPTKPASPSAIGRAMAKRMATAAAAKESTAPIRGAYPSHSAQQIASEMEKLANAEAELLAAAERVAAEALIMGRSLGQQKAADDPLDLEIAERRAEEAIPVAEEASHSVTAQEGTSSEHRRIAQRQHLTSEDEVRAADRAREHAAAARAAAKAEIAETSSAESREATMTDTSVAWWLSSGAQGATSATAHDAQSVLPSTDEPSPSSWETPIAVAAMAAKIKRRRSRYAHRAPDEEASGSEYSYYSSEWEDFEVDTVPSAMPSTFNAVAKASAEVDAQAEAKAQAEATAKEEAERKAKAEKEAKAAARAAKLAAHNEAIKKQQESQAAVARESALATRQQLAASKATRNAGAAHQQSVSLPSKGAEQQPSTSELDAAYERVRAAQNRRNPSAPLADDGAGAIGREQQQQAASAIQTPTPTAAAKAAAEKRRRAVEQIEARAEAANKQAWEADRQRVNEQRLATRSREPSPERASAPGEVSPICGHRGPISECSPLSARGTSSAPPLAAVGTIAPAVVPQPTTAEPPVVAKTQAAPAASSSPAPAPVFRGYRPKGSAMGGSVEESLSDRQRREARAKAKADHERAARERAAKDEMEANEAAAREQEAANAKASKAKESKAQKAAKLAAHNEAMRKRQQEVQAAAQGPRAPSAAHAPSYRVDSSRADGKKANGKKAADMKKASPSVASSTDKKKAGWFGRKK